MTTQPLTYQRSFHVEHPHLEEVLTCPICNHSKLSNTTTVKDHSISKEEFNIVQCTQCHFKLTSPRPDKTSVGSYYQSPQYISHSDTSETFRDKLYQIARKWSIKQKFRILHKYQPRGHILDIGSGTGQFLAYHMSRGYLVSGIEPDDRARANAMTKYGIEVLPNLRSIPATEQFQVVTMWHVLEHVPDIRETLKQIYSRTSANGILMIAVPDNESWDATHYRTDWAALDVPRHFWHFTQKDLHRLFTEHGFDLIETRRMWLDAIYISILSESYKGSTGIVGFVKGVTLGLYSNLISIVSGRPTSSSLYIVKKQKAREATI